MTKGNKALLWIAVLLVLLVAAGTAYYIVLSNNTKEKNVVQQKTEVFVPTVKDGSFVTNLKDSRHFLKVSLVIEVANKAMLSEFNSKDYIVNDIVVSVLSNKTMEETTEDGFQAKLKNELINALNKHFGERAVVNIYFNEFVIQ